MSDQFIFKPDKKLSEHALIKSMDEYNLLYKNAIDDLEGFWDRYAKKYIDWIKPYNKVLDESNAPFYKWFIDGKLNVSYLCLDRHLKKMGNKTAILFEGERGDVQNITYKELFDRVCKTANLLKNQMGIKKGDRVIIYMPMIPELPIAMLACARIGAIHSVVFGGFSAESIKDRVIDAQAKLIITADGAFRRGNPYMLKPIVDEALASSNFSVEKVLIVKRNNEKFDFIAGRDVIYNELIKNESPECNPEVMDSEDPLFLLYTSGSTGKPKGVQHSQAGYILWSQLTMEWSFDIKENDIYWCTADIGWVTGHTYIVYGPLAIGGTTFMYEGTPIYPDAGRFWKLVQDHKINIFYTAPTAIRLLHKLGPDEPKKYNLTSLRIIGTVGEPINPDAWLWYHENVGNKKCPIIDTWWQTETGGHMINPLPGATSTKPGSACFPLPGIIAEILDKNGNKKQANDKGLLCITRPWPSMIRTIWGDPDRYVKNYFSTVKKDGKPVYFTGDGASYDDDGYFWITGRVDDVLNVSGHRIGTAEIESAISHNHKVAEVAVVGKPDAIKGESIFAFVVLKESENHSETAKEINQTITKEIGAIAKADSITFVPGLPKTRSGKIMRRILRSIAKGEKITQDISTLEDPTIVDKIQKSITDAQ
ncbi:MAG: acetate--CoA ligase [Spirochaetota bacterium]|nr:acetate--CoA ligase [Spirochaetota bacterium]